MSDYKPFSIIIADSMYAVEEIHAARELPPLLSWKEENDRLNAEAQKQDPIAPAMTAVHLKGGYLMQLRDRTLYAVLDESVLRQQDATQAAGFPTKAAFVAHELWVSIDGEASNVRDRSGQKYKIDEIPVPFDIVTRQLDETGLKIDLISLKKGYIGTLIDSYRDGMRMTLISVIDHITNELSTASEYSVHPILDVVPEGHVMTLPAETWVLRRTVTADIIHTLGCFTNEAGAKAALEYLKATAQH